MKIRGVLLVVVALVMTSAAKARKITVRGPGISRSLSCSTGGTTSWSFTEGQWYTGARTALLDTANFGPNGVVTDEIVFNPPFDSMGAEDLDGADILLLNPIIEPVDWSRDVEVFEIYAKHGVGFISFQNSAVTFLAELGGCTNVTTSNFTSAGVSSPLATGPFGTIANYFTGWNCTFTNIASGAVQAGNNNVGPNLLYLDYGLDPAYPNGARAVSLADEEIFASLGISGCGSAHLNSNTPFFLNTFAYVGATARDPIPDDVEGTGDADNDGRPNYLDGDTDGDSILDLFEAGDADPLTPPVDTDKDTIPDYLDTDSDNDGLNDNFEGASLRTAPADTDGDGVYDFRDPDIDDDTILDGEEGIFDFDRDSFPDMNDPDSDNDGIPDSEEAGDADLSTPAVNTDQDPWPDYLDTDSDNDGVDDDVDNCRLVANADQGDANENGLGDVCDANADTDSVPNDGDASGTVGDAPCATGETSGCDDNCPTVNNEDQLDTDGDGAGDACDDDDDNDGALDTDDPTPLDASTCGDADNDTCDDCANGTADVANDGTDTDGDGLCDAGDACLSAADATDSDGDGVCDADDACPDASATTADGCPEGGADEGNTVADEPAGEDTSVAQPDVGGDTGGADTSEPVGSGGAQDDCGCTLRGQRSQDIPPGLLALGGLLGMCVWRVRRRRA